MFIFDNLEYNIYNNLINELYHSASYQDMNNSLTYHLNKLIPTDSSIFLLYKDDGITAKSSIIVNLEEKLFTDYLNFYQKLDLYKDTIHQLDKKPIVNRASDYLNYHEWERNEHRADFLKPQKIYHMACMEVIHDNKILASLSLHRSKNHSDFSDKEMGILKLLAPIIKIIYRKLQFDFNYIAINDKLTAREQEIFPLLTKNYSTKELSSLLSVSNNTIKTHIKNILTKTNCSSRFELLTKLKKIKAESNDNDE